MWWFGRRETHRKSLSTSKEGKRGHFFECTKKKSNTLASACVICVYMCVYVCVRVCACVVYVGSPPIFLRASCISKLLFILYFSLLPLLGLSSSTVFGAFSSLFSGFSEKEGKEGEKKRGGGKKPRQWFSLLCKHTRGEGLTVRNPSFFENKKQLNFYNKKFLPSKDSRPAVESLISIE